MKLAILQPYFFPYLGYFQLMSAVDRFVVFDDVGYVRRRWINRNSILVQSRPAYITVPVLNASPSKLICEVEVDFENAWKTRILETLRHSYRRAPYFEATHKLVENVLNSTYSTIGELAERSILAVKSELGISCSVHRSSAAFANRTLRSTSRIIDICRREGADVYCNPIGGTELYSESDFLQHGLELRFLRMRPISYRQFDDEFVDNLSIIDVLMFNSRPSIVELLKEYDLITAADANGKDIQ